MAKDEQNNVELPENEATEQNGQDGDIIGSHDDEGMDVRTLIFLEGQVKAGEPLVDKAEFTGGGDTYEEKTTIKLKTASGCGHIVHTAAEAGLTCLACQRLGRPEPHVLCSECSKNQNPAITCYICSTPCCYACRDIRFIDGEMRIVCCACIRSTLRIRLLKQIIKWALIAAAIYFLLTF